MLARNIAILAQVCLSHQLTAIGFERVRITREESFNVMLDMIQ